MELRLLRYFWTIATEGTMARAATVLHITQPTLSRQLRELETELGTPLFTRGKRHLELTEAGLFLKTRASEILELTQQTQQEFAARQQELFAGHLSIGCVEADNSDTLAKVLADFVAAYPAVTFGVDTATSEVIRDRLDKGLVDVAVLLEPVDVSKYHTLVLPHTEQWGLLVAADTPLAHQDAVTPADLRRLPLIISPRSDVQHMLTRWAQTDLAALHIVGHHNLIFNTIPLVARHVGAALTIEGALTNDATPATRFVPLRPAIATHCVLVWRKKRVLAPVVQAFIDQFKLAQQA